jgi:hypothetical protein
MTAKFISGSVTQGSADAFATASITTGIASVNLGLRIREIVVSWPSLVEVDANVQFEIMRRLPTAIVGVSDRRSVITQTRQIALTTSGLVVNDLITRIAYPKDLDLMIVEDPIYFSVDSNGTSLSNVIVCRIYYEEVRMTDVQKLSALQESANA